jgi:hypothetical protein
MSVARLATGLAVVGGEDRGVPAVGVLPVAPAGRCADRLSVAHELRECVAEHLAAAVVCHGERDLLARARLVSEHVFDAAG